MRDTIGELWTQIRIATTFGYDILGVLTLVKRKLQVARGRSTQRTTALPSEMCILCVRVGLEMQVASYASKHASQSLSNRPFYVYSALRRTTWKLQVVRECSAYQNAAVLSKTFFVCFRVALWIRLESYGPRHASVFFWYHIVRVYILQARLYIGIW